MDILVNIASNNGFLQFVHMGSVKNYITVDMQFP